MKTTGELLDQATSQGTTVEWANLGRRSGTYNHTQHRITLHTKLTSYQERSTLAHEISHAHWHDIHTTCPAESERMERRADAEAARNLITPAEYATAEAEVGSHIGALAEYLEVSTWVVEIWQREASYGRRWTCLEGT